MLALKEKIPPGESLLYFPVRSKTGRMTGDAVVPPCDPEKEEGEAL